MRKLRVVYAMALSTLFSLATVAVALADGGGGY
jgi:hypothetical protein